MPNSNDLLQTMLADARLVSSYGVRTGRLKDLELISAIAAVEEHQELSWRSDGVIALQAGLNRALIDISPVTINDLRNPAWDPFAPQEMWGWEKVAFAVFALLLLALTSCATSDYNRGSRLLVEANELAESAAAKDLFPNLNKLTALDLGSVDYQLAVSVVRDLDQRVHFYEGQSSQLWQRIKDQPYMKYMDALTWLLTWPTTLAPRVSALPDYVEAKWNLPDYGSYNPCVDQYVTSRASLGPAVVPPSLLTLQLAALCREHIRPRIIALAGIRNAAIEYPMQTWLDLWGLIYLPAIYGAFGATIFYMRRYLDPTLPDPSLPRVALRIATGAFAGLIITWFWAPSGQLVSGLSIAGLTILTVAFLVGFGVEVLFVLLDRLVGAAMAVAKGADARPALITPFYLGSGRTGGPEPPKGDKPDNKPGDNKPGGDEPNEKK